MKKSTAIKQTENDIKKIEKYIDKLPREGKLYNNGLLDGINKTLAKMKRITDLK